MYEMLAGLLPLAGNVIGGLFGGDSDYSGPSPEHYLNQVSQLGHETFDPYISRGLQSQDTASPIYSKLAQDPTSFVNQIMGSYKPSSGYQFREKRALDAMRNSAAAGGYTGTSEDQIRQAELVNGLLGQDMQQWLQNILGVQQTGLQGLQHEGNIGFDASGSLANMLGNTLGSHANLAYNRENQARAEANSRSNYGAGIGGQLGDILGKYIGNKYGSQSASQGMPSFGDGQFFRTNPYGKFK